MLLVRSCVDITEDPIHINLPTTTFWKRVTVKYNHKVPMPQGKEEIYSKWRHANALATQFKNVFRRMIHEAENGENENILLKNAWLRGRINRAGHLTPDGAFTWSKWIPNKVNCFVWRARIDRIPSACALIRRGVKIQDETCSVCISGSETADHMLVTCPFAIAIWNGIWNWCEIIPPQLSNVKEILNFVAMCGKPQTKKRTINSIIFGTLWGMWKARNDRVFNSKFIPPELVFKGVRCMVYTWIKFRHGK
uniref:Reverse transcriptase zinc-binding domain-containing protein n=1 Tax=Lactuca sativa TaxID=4236 RepID=A0A9R1V1V0_LACSA|nr:hypothetical protein LSAT_V11C700344400 [Lactuca sativa]